MSTAVIVISDDDSTALIFKIKEINKLIIGTVYEYLRA